ncbi:MAG: DUF2752 domain-containing protein [Lewinella sp.]|nr:DUF2752 domain-containing protein [Lewinella sp.]
MRIVWIILGIFLLSGLVWVYSSFNPSASGLFPKCPFRSLTGWQCPGCGSQRAVHYLLNGRIGPAFRANPLMVLSIPYLALGFSIRLSGIPENLRRRAEPLYEGKAVWIAGAVLLIYWIGRNII